MEKKINSFWKACFWLLTLSTLWLSLIPVDQVPAAFSFWDKAQHALGFAALAFTGLQSYPHHKRQLLLGLLLLGMGIEYAQYLTGWRQGDWADILADYMGLALGQVVWQFIRLAAKR